MVLRRPDGAISRAINEIEHHLARCSGVVASFSIQLGSPSPSSSQSTYLHAPPALPGSLAGRTAGAEAAPFETALSRIGTGLRTRRPMWRWPPAPVRAGWHSAACRAWAGSWANVYFLFFTRSALGLANVHLAIRRRPTDSLAPPTRRRIGVRSIYHSFAFLGPSATFPSCPLSCFSFLSTMTTLPAPTPAVPTSTTAEPPSTNDSKHASITSTLGLPAASPSSAAELARLTLVLRAALRQFPDFPAPGVLFEDIMPIFADASTHESLIHALELHCLHAHSAGGRAPDVIVGLDARGFLFGPTLALRLGAGFVPVRKKGKLPGPTVTAGFVKEYGEDLFQIQADSIKKGQSVLIVDDIIATGT